LGLNFLVTTLNKLGRYGEAKSFMWESIALCEQTKNRWGIGTAYRYLGVATLAGGQPVEAQDYFRKSLEHFGNYIVGWDIARTLTYLGDAMRLSGDPAVARKDYQDALSLAIEAKSPPIAMDALLGLACLQAQAGEVEKALILCHFILDHPCSEAETICGAGQLCTSLQAQLSLGQAEAARARAQAQSLDMIVNEALDIE
jgi:tetratricopeptide (TPR) repeat protein